MIFERDEWKCVYCSREVFITRSPLATADHVVARSQHGENEVSNLVTACEHCNQRKGDLPVDVFLLTLQVQESCLEMIKKKLLSINPSLDLSLRVR